MEYKLIESENLTTENEIDFIVHMFIIHKNCSLNDNVCYQL